jgi:hypothetical protein
VCGQASLSFLCLPQLSVHPKTFGLYDLLGATTKTLSLATLRLFSRMQLNSRLPAASWNQDDTAIWDWVAALGAVCPRSRFVATLGSCFACPRNVGLISHLPFQRGGQGTDMSVAGMRSVNSPHPQLPQFLRLTLV